MKIKGPKSTLRYFRILQEKGKGVQIRLVSGLDIWLPQSKVDFQIENGGVKIAVIPLWLKKKIDKELNYDGSDSPPEQKKDNNIPF